MSEIHIVHKRIGGVGHIARLLEAQGHMIMTPILKELLVYAKNDEVEKIYFHQPLSHLYCLMTTLINPSHRKKMCCILHESASYNLGAAKFPRAQFGYVARLTVIRACGLFGIELRGVSEYVCNSYYLSNKNTISFLDLFKSALVEYIVGSVPKEDIAVAWLRKGTAEETFSCLIDLQNSGNLSGAVLLGDTEEISILKKKLRLHSQLVRVAIVDERPSLTQDEFYSLLQRSRWFLSFFAREGFGLSVFQATFFGCIVLAAWSGAIAEWLPEENRDILLQLRSDAASLNSDVLFRVSITNKNFARRRFK